MLVYSGFRQVYTGFWFIQDLDRMLVYSGLYRMLVYSGFRQVYTGCWFIQGLDRFIQDAGLFRV
jgi:hypothetical protein